MSGVHVIIDEYAYLELRWLAMMRAPTELVMPLARMDAVLLDVTQTVEDFKLSVRDFHEAALKLSSQDPWRVRKISKRFPGPKPKSSPSGRAHASRLGAPGPQWTRRPRSQLQAKHSYYQGNF